MKYLRWFFDESILPWYCDHFPTDELGVEISPNASFMGLFEALDNYRDVYEYLGVSDSLIRERVFKGLADKLGEDYSYVYN